MRRASSHPPFVLALDVGTSSCRASLYDATGARVRDVGAQVAYRPRATPDGGAELDPDLLFEHVCEAIDGVAAQWRDTGAVAAVAATTFWHSLVGVDEQGRAATPVYLWMDARSRAEAEALKLELDARAVHARTGCVLHSSYWPARLRWLARAQPDRFTRVHRWLSFGEYAHLRLFGRPGASVSMASGTGLLNQHTRTWDEPLLRHLPLRREQLSPLRPLDQPFEGLGAPFAARWPWLSRVPWLPAVGDGATSNLGAGCATRERYALMVGTSGAERVVWRADAFQVPWGLWSYRVDDQRVVLGGALNDGGSLFAWLRGALRLPPVRAAEQALARLEPDSHGLTILPFWAGERSPGWAADARGAIVGLGLHTQPVEILRAALEAVALRFLHIDTRLRQAAPEGRQIVATGGALLRSPTWMQIMADVLGRPVLASTELQASSRGAALLALEVLGRLPKPLEEVQPAGRRVYDPIPAHTERFRAAADRQQRLYELLVPRGL